VAWPESLLPLESDGESVPVEEEPLVEDEPPEDEVSLEEEVSLDEDVSLEDEDDVVLDELVDDAAWAAMPTPSVPARLAAISAPVMVVVRRSPDSRSMDRPPHLLTTQRTVPDPLLEGLCCC
jgi:hypothetical protein